jgi:thiamine pyrophosphate-dependent acetolactate synthase large subunit-like protein
MIKGQAEMTKQDDSTFTTATNGVAHDIGYALAEVGVTHLFGVVGSGNFAVAAAAHAAGVRYVASRHEAGAVAMADGYARATGDVGIATVHQGPGFTNAVTPLVEAAKSRTPLVLLAADSDRLDGASNFAIDQAAIAQAARSMVIVLTSADSARIDVLEAIRRARTERRTITVLMPLDVQMAAPSPTTPASQFLPTLLRGKRAVPEGIGQVAKLLADSERPLLLAGRGAVLSEAGPALRKLGAAAGALIGTTAVAKSLFRGDPFDLGVLGGFSSPTTAALAPQADLVVAFGASLNPWTTRHGDLFPSATIVQVDDDPSTFGLHQPVDVAVVGDAALTAEALTRALEAAVPRGHWRTPEISSKLAKTWRDEPYDDRSTDDRIDPRTFTLALGELLPADVKIATDSGHFLAWPAIYLDVPDPRSFVFAQAFQSVGLGLPTAIGAHLGSPDRLTVAPVGDGGFLMSASELETLGRLRLPVLVVVYNDAMYGAEIHHFGHNDAGRSLASFTETDLAAFARAAGCEALTVRNVDDVEGISDWLARRDGPLLVDVKVEQSVVVSFLDEAFRGEAS